MSWQDFLARHQVGDVIEGVVTDQVPFGSFVESEGVTGLAPGQSWPAGTRVSVRILALDPDTARATKELLAQAPGHTLEEQAAAERRVQAALQRGRLTGR